MAWNECPECFEKVCICGAQYRDLSPERKLQLAAAVLGMKQDDLKNRLADVSRESVIEECALLVERHELLDGFHEWDADSVAFISKSIRELKSRANSPRQP